MICCREFVKAFKKGVFEFGLDANGDAKLEIKVIYGPTRTPVVRHAFNMNYCPFCGAKLDTDYKTPQGPFEPDMEEIFHPGGVVEPVDHSIVVKQEPGPGPHTTV